MKRVAKILTTVLVIGLLAFTAVGIMSYMGYGPKEAAPQAQGIAGNVKGFFVDTLGGKEFPFKKGLEAKELREEIDKIIDFASLSGFNAIFFEVKPDRTALYHSKYFPLNDMLRTKDGIFSFFNRFDALDYLCGASKEKNLSVYAVVNPYYAGAEYTALKKKYPSLKPGLTTSLGGEYYFNPSNKEVMELIANASGEIAAKYPVSGIIYRDVTDSNTVNLEEYKDNLAEMLELSSAKISAADPSKKLGIVLEGAPSENGFDLSPDYVSELVAKGDVDIIIPAINTEAEDYESLVSLWSSAAGEDEATVITANSTNLMAQKNDSLSPDNVRQLGYQLFVNSTIPSVSGTVFSSYSDLLANPSETENLMSYLWDTPTEIPEIDLSFLGTLSINPSSAITVSSDYTAYYITGTSDPQKPLLLNGKAVERKTTNGVFGILVDLNQGRNVFEFSQESEKISLVITRPKPSTLPSKISKITQNSIFPTFSYPVENDQSFTIKCMGPSGAKITAQVGDSVVTLKQVAATAESGIPATFTADISISGYDNDLVTELGPITYTLNYGGAITTYKSNGSIYVKGKNATLALETTQPMTGLYADENSIVKFITDVKAGAVDTIEKVGKTRYLTGTGGYVDFKSSKIISGKVDIINKVSRIEYEKSDTSEVYTLKGTNYPVYKFDRTDSGLNVTLYNTEFEIEDLKYIESDLFQNVTLNKIDKGVVLSFDLKPGSSFWGYDISFKDGDTLIYIKKSPQKENTYARPLQGITVMLDAGHGGKDPGALGAAGEKGPFESKLNLAVSYMTKIRLEQLGANVTMTRADDSEVALFDRHFFAVEQRPDYFISIHHNSTPLTTDANNISGLQVYYLNDISKSFADMLTLNMDGRLKRNVETPYVNAFYVTRQTLCPSVLLEVGYISNPVEQEISSNIMEIYKTACGIADAIVADRKAK